MISGWRSIEEDTTLSTKLNNLMDWKWRALENGMLALGATFDMRAQSSKDSRT
ncbi:hypothetical protein O9992_27420 [Vibrio lentus]|nr:hypothetical protein [Vibrio lentus]